MNDRRMEIYVLRPLYFNAPNNYYNIVNFKMRAWLKMLNYKRNHTSLSLQ